MVSASFSLEKTFASLAALAAVWLPLHREEDAEAADLHISRDGPARRVSLQAPEPPQTLGFHPRSSRIALEPHKLQYQGHHSFCKVCNMFCASRDAPGRTGCDTTAACHLDLHHPHLFFLTLQAAAASQNGYVVAAAAPHSQPTHQKSCAKVEAEVGAAEVAKATEASRSPAR